MQKVAKLVWQLVKAEPVLLVGVVRGILDKKHAVSFSIPSFLSLLNLDTASILTALPDTMRCLSLTLSLSHTQTPSHVLTKKKKKSSNLLSS